MNPLGPGWVLHLDPDQVALVRSELERLLLSIEFRNTRRVQHFLRYLVEQLLEGRADLLKERIVGAELFKRSPDYDTGADAIVRVTANEIRKKLAQYYVHATDSEVRIELPAGSYIPEFVWRIPDSPAPESAPPETPAAKHRLFQLRSRKAAWVGGALALPLMVAVFLVSYRRDVPPLERFWAPVLRGAGPVVICLSNPVVYGLSPAILVAHQREHPEAADQGPYAIDLGDRLIPGRQIIPVFDQYVGNGEAFALGELTSLFTRLHKPYETRIGGDVSTADLRKRSTIFLGFSSRWNLEMSRGLRFSSHIENNVKMIRDAAAPNKSWSLPNLAPDGRTSVDYALVSRVFHPDTGMPLLQACGITQYGCQTAGEFLSNPAYFSQALPHLPPGWERRNIQIVLVSRILRTSPGAPKVVAVHVW